MAEQARGAISYSLANEILKFLTGQTAQVSSTAGTIYAGLSSTEPTRNGTNITEPSAANGYARVLLGNYNQSLTIKMGTPSNGTVTNTVQIPFNQVLNQSWGTLSYTPLYTAGTGGTFLGYAVLTTPLVTIVNNVPLIQAGQLNMSF